MTLYHVKRALCHTNGCKFSNVKKTLLYLYALLLLLTAIICICLFILFASSYLYYCIISIFFSFFFLLYLCTKRNFVIYIYIYCHMKKITIIIVIFIRLRIIIPYFKCVYTRFLLIEDCWLVGMISYTWKERNVSCIKIFSNEKEFSIAVTQWDILVASFQSNNYILNLIFFSVSHNYKIRKVISNDS